MRPPKNSSKAPIPQPQELSSSNGYTEESESDDMDVDVDGESSDYTDYSFETKVPSTVPSETPSLTPPRASTSMGPPPPRSSEKNSRHRSRSQSKPSKSQSKPKRKKPKERSWVWGHFDKYEDKYNRWRAICKHCKIKHYAADSSRHGTSSMANHLRRCQDYLKTKVKENNTLDKYVGQMTGENVPEGARQLGKHWELDLIAIRRALMEMIIIDELPFSFVENERFRKFMMIVCPMFGTISKTTATRDCLQIYASEQAKLKAYFEKSDIMICLTTDTWTSNQRLTYLCLTGHFVDDDWKLCKRILNFIPCPSHKGADIGVMIENCLDEWGIKRIFSVTVDNATSNDKCLEYLAERYSARNMCPLGGKMLQMRCVRQTPMREKKFREYCKEEKIECKLHLVLDVPTRWNSTYQMLVVALEYQAAFDRYARFDSQFQNDFNGTKGTSLMLGLQQGLIGFL